MHETFHIFASKSHWYEVQIHDTPESMVTEIVRLRKRALKSDRDIRAVCMRYVHSVEVDGKMKDTGLMGSILFVRDDLEVEVVVHEMAHAAVGWANRTSLKIQGRQPKRVVSSGEEKFACSMETLIGQFYAQVGSALKSLALSLFTEKKAA